MTIRPATDAHWMQLQVDTLFACDAGGRIEATASPSDVAAPRFFLGRTRHGNLWRFRADLGARAIRHLSRLAGREPPLSQAPEEEPSPPERMQAFRDVLEGEGEAIHSEWRGPAWHFDAAGSLDTFQAFDAVSGLDASSAVRVTADDAPRFAAHFGWLADEFHECSPVFGVLESDTIVALCFCARGGEKAAEAGVETVAAARRRGYATRAVSAWANSVRASGREPLYSTSWDNHASRAVANRLRLTAFGEDLHFT